MDIDYRIHKVLRDSFHGGAQMTAIFYLYHFNKEGYLESLDIFENSFDKGNKVFNDIFNKINSPASREEMIKNVFMWWVTEGFDICKNLAEELNKKIEVNNSSVKENLNDFLKVMQFNPLDKMSIVKYQIKEALENERPSAIYLLYEMDREGTLSFDKIHEFDQFNIFRKLAEATGKDDFDDEMIKSIKWFTEKGKKISADLLEIIEKPIILH